MTIVPFPRFAARALICAATLVAGGLVAPQRSNAEEPKAPASDVSQGDLPAGKDLIEKFIEVSGGKEAFAKLTSRESSGTFELAGMGIKGTFSMKQQAPDKAYIVIDLPGMGKIEQGSDGETVWEASAMQGARIVKGLEREDRMRQFRLDSETNWQQFFKSADTVGVESVDGKPAYKVKLTSANPEAQPTYFFYDKESNLLVGMEMSIASAMGVIPVKGTVGNYQDFDGIKMPTQTTQEFQGMKQVITIGEVKHNQPIEPSAFALPDSIKQLKAQPPTTQPK